MITKAVAAAAAGLSLASMQVEAQGKDSAWIIRGGTYSGRTVAIDRALATRRSSRFWRLSSIKGDGRIVGWNPSSLPAKVALRGRGATSSDSAAFWSILRRMEEDMGMRLFEPISLSPDSDDRSIIVVDLKAMTTEGGITYITWSTSGTPYDARVFLGSASLLRDSRVVAHEMMHALGFGHTASWESIMSSGPFGPDRLTEEDVAYAQAAFESRAANEREDMWERLALAASREDSGGSRAGKSAACPAAIESAMDIIESAGSARGELPIADRPRLSSCFR